jgi:hypothetical protein
VEMNCLFSIAPKDEKGGEVVEVVPTIFLVTDARSMSVRH